MTSKTYASNFWIFASKGHVIVPSAPIVLKDDPTLMFNNSGMAQSKNIFWETERQKQQADTQKCLRVRKT
jgi:alanyl-tRNA synthetase